MIRNSISGNLSSSLRKNISFKVLAFFIAIICLNSCYNEPNLIGSNLIPEEDKLSIETDTSFSVSAFTVSTSKVPTNYYQFAVLGNYNSDIFGKVKSEFCSNFVPNSVYNPQDTFFYKKSPRPIATSLILRMIRQKTFGIQNTPVDIKVYELEEPIKDSSGVQYYYNGLDPFNGVYKPTVIGTKKYTGEDTLKIDISSFAERLRTLPDSAYKTTTNFTNLIKGLYITSDNINSTGGALYFFDNKIELIYTFLYNDNNGLSKKAVVRFYSTSNSQRYNHYIHDYDNSQVKEYIDDTMNIKPYFFIDGLGGLKGMIKFNDVVKWAEKMPVAIHKAELRIETKNYIGFNPDSIINPIHYYFKKRYLKTYSNISNDVYEISDTKLTGNYLSKFFKAKKYYSIDVTLHIQNLIKGEIKNNNIYLDGSNENYDDFKYNYGQGVFNANDIKLILTYSKL